MCFTHLHCACLWLLQQKSKKLLVPCIVLLGKCRYCLFQSPCVANIGRCHCPTSPILETESMLWWKLDKVQKHLCSGAEEFLLSQYCRLEAEEEVLQVHSYRVSSISVCLWVEKNVTLGIFGSCMLHQAISSLWTYWRRRVIILGFLCSVMLIFS